MKVNPLQLLPPWWIIVLFGVMFLFTTIVEVGVEPGRPGVDGGVESPAATLLLLAAFALGVYRAVRFHPACRAGYLDWLTTKPLAGPFQLPFGPVHLVPADAIVPALLAGLTFTLRYAVEPTWWQIIMVFLGAYVAVLTVTNLLLGEWRSAYMVVFLLGCIARFAHLPSAVAMCLAAIYAASIWGVRRSFTWFPWEDAPLFRYQRFDVSKIIRYQCAGSPVSPPDVSVAPIVPVRHALLLGLTVAWLVSGMWPASRCRARRRSCRWDCICRRRWPRHALWSMSFISGRR